MKVSKIQPWIGELIEVYQGIYTTPHNIELIINLVDDSFYIGGKWNTEKSTEFPAIELEINGEFADYAAFENVFPIQHLAELDNLNKDDFFRLYQEGQMGVNAVFDERGCFWDLNFKIHGANTYITNSETNSPINYIGLLATPEEILAFTKEYLKTHPPKLDPRMVGRIRRGQHLP